MTIKTVISFLEKNWKLGVGALVGAGLMWLMWPSTPPPKIVYTPGNTTTIEVPKEVLTTKEVVKYVVDKTEVAKLMAENEVLRNKVTSLSETIANHQSTGTGPVVPVPPTEPSKPVGLRFADWRLNFVSDGVKADYTLTQKFEVLTTQGRNDLGVPINSVRLFEIGPGDRRTPITDLSTRVVQVDQARSHLFVRPILQGGVHISPAGWGGVIEFQWLKKGKSNFTKEITYDLLKPGISVASNKTVAPVLSPISYNLGSLPHQPFTNIWVGPVVGFKVAWPIQVDKIGLAITASF